MKLRILRHGTHKGEMRNTNQIVLGKQAGRTVYHSGDLDIYIYIRIHTAGY
jgi:L-ascorbate metabolism protein UlaG (beta-lactamase superfamily)